MEMNNCKILSSIDMIMRAYSIEKRRERRGYRSFLGTWTHGQNVHY